MSGEDDRECAGEPQDTCESLELSIVQIGLETYRSYERKKKKKKTQGRATISGSGLLDAGIDFWESVEF